ncbi:hypothetical protein N0V90_003194 [Kalmusia sp. IMI 367209]|nr:hypothetical protein N0V90_003194 [Kalmusia sp. IMI 367209]
MSRARRFIKDKPTKVYNLGAYKNYATASELEPIDHFNNRYEPNRHGYDYDSDPYGAVDAYPNDDDPVVDPRSATDRELERRIAILQHDKKKYKERCRFLAGILTAVVLVTLVRMFVGREARFEKGFHRTDLSWLLPDYVDVLDLKGFKNYLAPEERESTGASFDKWYTWKVEPWMEGGRFCDGMVDEAYCEAARKKYGKARDWYLEKYLRTKDQNLHEDEKKEGESSTDQAKSADTEQTHITPFSDPGDPTRKA